MHPSPPDLATDDSDAIWIVGSFPMTGAPLARHASTVLSMALGTGMRVRAITPRAGAFGETNLADAMRNSPQGPGTAVIYLPPVLGAVTMRRGVRILLDVFRLTRRARCTVAVRDTQAAVVPRIMQMTLVAALRLTGRRTDCMTLNTSIGDMADLLPGTPARTVDRCPDRIAFAHIRAAAPAARLRLTPSQVQAAIRGLEDRGLAAPLAGLADIAAKLPTAEVAAALTYRDLGDATTRSGAVRAALQPVAPGSDMTRLARHLKLLGKPRAAWARYRVPALERRSPGPGTIPAILRQIAGQPDNLVPQGLLRPLAPGAMTGLEWLTVQAMRPTIEDLSELKAPWASPDLLHRVLGPLRPCPPSIDVVGMLTQDTGLSRNAWMTARCLGRAGIEPRLSAVDAPPGSVTPISRGHRVRRGTRMLHPTAIWHLNADRIPQELIGRYARQSPYHIGFLLWELDRIPPAHRLALDMLDEIWAPSAFVADIYRRATDRPVILMRKGIALPRPADSQPCRPGVTRFLICFDYDSSVARKNPLAAVRGFRDAFQGRDDVELIIKSTPARKRHWGDPDDQMDKIRRLAADDDRVHLIEAFVPFEELIGLVASTDALISTHRAEGFGYMPAYALSFGVPVVVTDWSGTRDFCNQATSFPVDASLVAVPDGHAIHPTPGARWAEVDHDALVAALRSVADDPAMARSRAATGRQLIRSLYSHRAQGARYAARLSELGLIADQEPRGQAGSQTTG